MHAWSLVWKYWWLFLIVNLSLLSFKVMHSYFWMVVYSLYNGLDVRLPTQSSWIWVTFPCTDLYQTFATKHPAYTNTLLNAGIRRTVQLLVYANRSGCVCLPRLFRTTTRTCGTQVSQLQSHQYRLVSLGCTHTHTLWPQKSLLSTYACV